ncbi:unnamed protein product, partial [Rotaria socialis]
ISIYVLGDVYFDIDTRPDNYTNASLIIGVEVEGSTSKQNFVRPVQLCSWRLAGKSNHLVLNRMKDRQYRKTHQEIS